MNHRLLHHRITAWPALLASLVFVCWPTLVRGSCCCDSNVRPSGSLSETADSCCQQSTSCCQSPGIAVPSNAEAAARACCDTTNTGACGSSDDCRCGVRCCRSLTVIASSHTTDSDQDRGAIANLAEATIEFPVGIPVLSSLRPDVPDRFLLAQDHCALICCWLK